MKNKISTILIALGLLSVSLTSYAKSLYTLKDLGFTCQTSVNFLKEVEDYVEAINTLQTFNSCASNWVVDGTSSQRSGTQKKNVQTISDLKFDLLMIVSKSTSKRSAGKSNRASTRRSSTLEAQQFLIDYQSIIDKINPVELWECNDEIKQFFDQLNWNDENMKLKMEQYIEPYLEIVKAFDSKQEA